MEPEEIRKLTLDLTAERDREKLLARVGDLAELPSETLLEILVDALLLVGHDADRLKRRIADLLSTRFGTSSEKSSPDQIAMFEKLLRRKEAPEVPASEPEAPAKLDVPEIVARTNQEIAALEAERRQLRVEEKKRLIKEAKATNGSGPWPKHLPVEERYIDVPEDEWCCSDPNCGRLRVPIRQERSWFIEVETTAKVVVIIRPIRACPRGHGKPVCMPAPPAPVDRGHLGFGLAARVLYLRFAHNLPVLRITELLAADGVLVTDDVLHTLFDTTVERAQPVIEALIAQVRKAKVVNLDDTPVLILKGRGPDREKRKGRIWVAIGDGKLAWFFATKTWKASEAEERLGAIEGTLQGDGYAGFPKFVRRRNLQLAGCMAHFRRKLKKAASEPQATEALALVHALYRVEWRAKLGRLDADGRRALRQERSVPIFDALEAWAKRVAPTIEPGSPLGQAWTYLDRQCERLRVFLDDGRVSIDNNIAERGLRRITIGRKLWLFFRSDENVERAARLASLFLTARLHGANELAYIRWLLEELARREWSVEAAGRLLPAAWLAQKQAEQGARVEG